MKYWLTPALIACDWWGSAHGLKVGTQTRAHCKCIGLSRIADVEKCAKSTKKKKNSSNSRLSKRVDNNYSLWWITRVLPILCHRRISALWFIWLKQMRCIKRNYILHYFIMIDTVSSFVSSLPSTSGMMEYLSQPVLHCHRQILCISTAKQYAFKRSTWEERFATFKTLRNFFFFYYH